MSAAESNIEAAERIVGLMRAHGVQAVLIGAVALAAHHYPRHTANIDLGVNADLKTMRSLASCLKDGGYAVELREPDLDDPLGGVIDVSGPFGLVQIISFANRFPIIIQDALAGEDIRIRPGSELRLVPIPQLVALKLYAGGYQSLADIIGLLRRNPGVDLDEIRATCRRYRLRGIDALLNELNPP
jgi:hypothetical protein